jgi:two-component system OmpR family sensor kinase/two-component system sensor histidine kinase BaeS
MKPRPPWWPINEPWPPRYGPYAWQRRRRRFNRGFGGAVAIALFLVMVGLMTVLSWLFSGTPAFALRPIGVLIGMVWLFVILRIFQRLMWRIGMPLGDIVSTADRVAEGDYTARATEHGPRWMRGIAETFNAMVGKLQVQDRQRRELMADIAHELRTPLAVLQGRLEGMLDGVYPRDEAQIAAVLQETKMLSRLVDDLRTLAHSESGTLALQKEPTDVGMLIDDAVASFSADARQRSVALNVSTPADLPTIEIDPVRIREVVTNLVSNAMRHTPAGGRVDVTAARRDQVIDVRIGDTGSGIAANDLPKIFDRFYKGRTSQGSGLGLTIARNLVVAHGGEIRAESREGHGTTITFTLPANLNR